MQDDVVGYDIVPKTVVADAQPKLPFPCRDVHQLADVGAALEVEGVSLEKLDGPEQVRVHARKSLAKLSRFPLEAGQNDYPIATRHRAT